VAGLLLLNVAAAHAAPVDGCTAKAVATNGIRRLALVVGVGKYKSKDIQQLTGPANDVRAFSKALVDIYGFPRENICTLLDEKATVAGFESAWQKALVDRAQAGDVAVFYFSGHGSQADDENGDEPSGMDQTLVFHDSRTGKVDDELDDRINQLLEQLHTKTPNVVVVSDSCNSGSVTRAAGVGGAIARLAPPRKLGKPASGFQAGVGKSWVPASLPGLVALTAAADGTSALEIGGHGVFTEALLQVLGQPSASLTYAQVARQVVGLVAARSPQLPYFQGKLDRETFGTAARPRPVGWEVKRVAGNTVELAGTPTPSMGKNAELRIFGGGGRREDYGDPTRSKALVTVISSSGLNAKAKMTKTTPGAAAVAPGDLALLVRPGDQAVQITVRLRPEKERGGIPGPRAEALRKAIQADADAKAAVIPSATSAELELFTLKDGRLQLNGVADEMRAVLSNDAEVVSVLWQLARQKALASLHGEGTPYFVDDESLQVEIVPVSAAEQRPCGLRRLAEFTPRRPGESQQVVPMCVIYRIKATLAAGAQRSVVIGGLALSGDGKTVGFPSDGSVIELKPGKSHVFRELFMAGPPLGARDTFKVIGTLPTNPVAWHQLTSDWRTRGGAQPGSPLHRALDRYLVAGKRGSPVVGMSSEEDTQWTVSTVSVQVEANPGFVGPLWDRAKTPPAKVDAVANFDLRPYLPDDRTTTLYRVLVAADQLAKVRAPGKAETVDATQKLGADSSQAIMTAFSQAKVPYNKQGKRLTTADMVAADTAMVDYFERCDGLPRQAGDIVVYRDDKRGEGQALIAIDPQRRIAWGSQGWDGKARAQPEAGVQYQLLKSKDDWKLGNRPDVREKACWRYRQFSQETRDGRGRPGIDALGNSPCESVSCTAVPPASSASKAAPGTSAP
jgi:uncharacterized caspase-like protein